jgi:hypothetical protein
MKYRAFIASTHEDLKRQREHVMHKLREANLDVIAMEEWTSAPEHPAVLSAKRIRGCHFCIALVAYQRGTVATNDPDGRSITQIEIAAAYEKKVRVLPFMLSDKSENQDAWPARFNQLNDPLVKTWRDTISTEQTCQFFDANEMPDPLPAITRQIAEWESQRRFWVQRALFGVVSLFLAILILFGFSNGARSWLLGRLYAFHDPSVFRYSINGKHNVARLLEGTSEIRALNFAETIRETRTSFVLFANTFGSFEEHVNDFRDAARRGVKLRFVVTDFSESNRHNWAAFTRATADDVSPTKETLANDEEATVANAKKTREKIRKLQKEFPASVELRLNSQPLFFTLWVRDPDEETGLAHLGIHYYGQKANWPAFRISKKTGAAHLAAMKSQFERIWTNSTVAFEK